MRSNMPTELRSYLFKRLPVGDRKAAATIDHAFVGAD